MASVIRVVVGLFEIAGLWIFWAFILPIAVMIVALFIVRFIPLAGWRRRAR